MFRSGLFEKWIQIRIRPKQTDPDPQPWLKTLHLEVCAPWPHQNCLPKIFLKIRHKTWKIYIMWGWNYVIFGETIFSNRYVFTIYWKAFCYIAFLFRDTVSCFVVYHIFIVGMGKWSVSKTKSKRLQYTLCSELSETNQTLLDSVSRTI